MILGKRKKKKERKRKLYNVTLEKLTQFNFFGGRKNSEWT